MHTLRFSLTSPPAHPGAAAFVRLAIPGIALLLLLAPVRHAHAQAGFPGVGDEPAVNLRVYPTDFWGPRAGVGAGLGVVGHNLLRTGDQWLLTAAPARHEQVATLSFASASPYRAGRYVLVDSRALHTDRDWLGPPSRRLTLRRSSVMGRVRIGQTALHRHLLVQPYLTLRSDHVDAVRAPSPLPEALSRVAPSIPAAPQTRTGTRVGLDLQYDTRAAASSFASGLRLRAGGARYFPLDRSALRFDQFDVAAEGVVRLTGLHRLVAHAEVTLTRPRTSTPIPVVLLPTLGAARIPGWARGQFVDRDRVLGSLLYRFPIWTFGTVATIEGHVGGHLANVYRDVGDQFRPRIRVDDAASSDRGRPLRPTASVGLRLDLPIRPVSAVDLALGIGPDGVSAARVSVSRPLRALRPPHHVSDNLLF